MRSEMLMAKATKTPVETKVLDTVLEGTPLLATKFTEFRDGKLQEESLLANCCKLRLIAFANDIQPEVYSVELISAKKSRFFSMSTSTWLEFTGLVNGGEASLSVDPDTNELVFQLR